MIQIYQIIRIDIDTLMHEDQKTAVDKVVMRLANGKDI